MPSDLGFVFAPKVPSVGSLGREPEVGLAPPFFRFGGDRLRSAAKRGFAALLRGGILLACKGSVSLSASEEGASDMLPLAPPHRCAFGEGKSVGGADCEASASR